MQQPNDADGQILSNMHASNASPSFLVALTKAEDVTLNVYRGGWHGIESKAVATKRHWVFVTAAWGRGGLVLVVNESVDRLSRERGCRA